MLGIGLNIKLEKQVVDDELDRMMRDLRGPDGAEKQVLLLKLVDLIENKPDYPPSFNLDADSPQRSWLAKARAVLERLDKLRWGTEFRAHMGTLAGHWAYAWPALFGVLTDAIEDLRLDLELDGRSEVGTAYAPGQVYQFFADLKKILDSASESLFIIDPYFDGTAFDDYIQGVNPSVKLRIFCGKYTNQVLPYTKKYSEQNGSNIELRKSRELHDRAVIIDGKDCWIMGGSIRDAGKKATYLVPLAPRIASQKIIIYEDIWARASPVT